jgi:hypothetical protein
MRYLSIAVTMLGVVALAAVANPAHGNGHAIRHGVEATADPAKGTTAIQVRFPRQAKRVGQANWILFNAANAQIHVFVEANRKREIQRMYMVQFESLLDSNKDYSYPIPNQPVVKLGQKDFFIRANAGKRTDPVQPGSEFEQVVRMLGEKGYTLPPETGSVRLLHYPNQARRSEVIILYWEDLRAFPDLYDGNFESLIDRSARAYSAKWTPLGEALKKRALERIQVTTP